MQTVYVVTAGMYSDYRILAIFSKKEDADAAALVSSDYADVEEWPMDAPYIIQRIKSGVKLWRVGMWLNGDVKDAWEQDTFREEDVKRFCALQEYSHWDGTITGCALYGDIEATTKEEAIKIMNERRIAWLLEHPQS